jgi:hypothetical protein
MARKAVLVEARLQEELGGLDRGQAANLFRMTESIRLMSALARSPPASGVWQSLP